MDGLDLEPTQTEPRDQAGDATGRAYGLFQEALERIPNQRQAFLDQACGADKRLRSEVDLGLLVIDYMQLMSSSGKHDNRVHEVSEISRGLKALSRELDIPVVALSQLSRGPEARTDKKPLLSDLRESGSIEQDADLVMFLFRPEYYFGPIDKDGNSLEGVSELIVAKQPSKPPSWSSTA